MPEFSGKMLDGRTFFGRIKDIGKNSKRNWYSSRFSIKPRHKPYVNFYSRTDIALAEKSGDMLQFRMAEDMAALKAHGVNVDSIKFHT